MENNIYLVELINNCIETEEIDQRVELRARINHILPEGCAIELPSLITNSYIDKTLFLLEELILNQLNVC